MSSAISSEPTSEQKENGNIELSLGHLWVIVGTILFFLGFVMFLFILFIAPLQEDIWEIKTEIDAVENRLRDSITETKRDIYSIQQDINRLKTTNERLDDLLTRLY